MKKYTIICTLLNIGFLGLTGCHNRDVNEGEQFRPREIHEEIKFHFDKIEVDGVEYLILEKDNNNPHEGFGFMAFRANKLIAKQDSVLAYLKTVNELNVQILAAISEKPVGEVRLAAGEVLDQFLNEHKDELVRLESDLRENIPDSTHLLK